MIFKKFKYNITLLRIGVFMKKIDWFKQWSYADNFFEDSFRDPTGEVWVKCDHPLSQKGWVVLKDLIVWELVGVGGVHT